ncbi:MAG: DUF924 family protein [Moraxella sp.]|nr:DUF924 family protein [Moraxella sp.]
MDIEKLPKSAKDVLEFWYHADNQTYWFVKSADFDNKIRDKFADLVERVAAGETSAWRANILGRLAEIIVLDQFTRNIYRGTPKAFAYDGVALVLSQEAVASMDFTKIDTTYQKFIAMPYMHSESKLIHEQAVQIFTAIGDVNTLDFELKHKAIIDRFGRYPHRNAILGRVSDEEELAFLQLPNSGF